MNRLSIIVALCVLWASDSLAVPHVFKHDQFSSGIAQAANEVSAMTLSVNPGFAKEEAFGQIFVPSSGMYPVRLTGLDLFMAAPPVAGTWTAHAQIEVWLHAGKEAHPGKDAPDWSITTYDLFNPMSSALGFPLQGGAAYSVDFDYDDPGGHPPLIYADNFRVVVRFIQTTQDLSAQWGTLSCSVIAGLLCGCQRVGTVQDTSIVPTVNVIHHLSTMGTCAGALTWDHAETLGVNGDFVMRVRADIAGGCSPSCGGKECGPDGCGGTCGFCGAGETCVSGLCKECLPQCGGNECGPDGCGGECGTCDAGHACVSGSCEPVCTPDCDDRECGDNGCGGECGTCPQAAPICEAGVCVAACVADCGDRECGDDGCGGSCGTCPNAAPVCTYGFCEPRCTPDCQGRQCGDDRCGGLCGTCSEATPLCVQGVCQADCTADCTDRECGSDGCRGSCGECPEGFTCQDGLCEEGAGGSGEKSEGCSTDRHPARPWMAIWVVLVAMITLWGVRRRRVR